MNFEQLKVFVNVVEAGGFRAAAETMHRSQPALTTAVKQLEDTIGLQLFDRSEYRPKLTPQGEAFYHKAKRLVAQMQNLQAFTDYLKQPVETELNIAIDMCCQLERFLPCFSQLMDEHPHTHFKFFTETLGGNSEKLINGQAEIAIAENLVSGVAIEVIPMHTVEFVAVASSKFIEKHQQALTDPYFFNQCVQVIIRDSSVNKDKFTFGVVEHANHWTVSDIYVKKQIILNGMGWGRLPRFMIEQSLAAGKLQLLSGEFFDTRTMEICAMRLQNKVRGQVAESLWQALKAISESQSAHEL